MSRQARDKQTERNHTKEIVFSQERRVLVTWRTSDGLSWEQAWWEGPPPTAGDQDGSLLRHDADPVSEHYGAVNYCVERGQTVRSGCRLTAADGGGGDGSSSYAPILSFLMPYDARRQQFWMDLAFSTDGLNFQRIEQEQTDEPATLIANGEIGEWNGGILMGIQPVDTETLSTGGAAAGGKADERSQWTDAVLPYADSGAHFMFAMRELNNFTTEAVKAWGQRQFFGPSIEQWPGWTTVGGVGGWEGLAKVGQRLRIEVGAVRWRKEGWVSLRATASNATIQTIPILPQISGGSNCGGSEVGASVNLQGAAVIAVLDAEGEMVAGFSGSEAARVVGDDVAAPLYFGPVGGNLTRKLPITMGGASGGVSRSRAIAFRVTLADRGSQLFGLSLRCL